VYDVREKTQHAAVKEIQVNPTSEKTSKTKNLD
jgi:hypothetical protein